MSTNRITASAERIRAHLLTLDSEKIKSLEAAHDIEPDEHFAYQERKTRAYMEGKLTTDEAQSIYVALGEVGSQKNGGWAKGTDLAMKLTVTKVIAELMGVRV